MPSDYVPLPPDTLIVSIVEKLTRPALGRRARPTSTNTSATVDSARDVDADATPEEHANDDAS